MAEGAGPEGLQVLVELGADPGTSERDIPDGAPSA
jgi:hypothetical protein